MLRIVILWIIILLLPLTSRAEIYRWTDSQGVTHFSDEKHDGATKIELAPIITYPAQPLPTTSSPTNSSAAKSTPVANNYTIVVKTPVDEENIPVGDSVEVKVDLDITPALSPEDVVQIIIDGELNQSGQSNLYQLTDLDRGKHILRAQIIKKIDDDGKLNADVNVLGKSEPVVFYVQHPSILLRKPAAGNGGLPQLPLTASQIQRIRNLITSQG